jgi:hypothetical protein
LVLIKPSHYDGDGYVIQWARSSIPSNSLACVYALAQDAAERQVLGPDIAIDISVTDETNTRVRVKDIVTQFKRHDGFGMVGLVGVQSNQFPRALDIARPLRQAGIPVAIGGFHVSGCFAMLPETQPDVKIALDLGCSLFAGEAEEGRMDAVLQDAARGKLAPVYNHMADLPALESSPSPILPPQTLKRTINYFASFDAGRGCPYQCSFCTIINVQGRKSRRRSPDDVELGDPPARPLRLPLVLRHRRQFRAQQGLGADLRPADRSARAPGLRLQAHHSGRHAMPQDPEFHLEGGARRSPQGLHRA